MIFEGSRYENSDIVRIVDSDDVARQTVIPAEPETSIFQFSYYTVKDGDRIDILAERFLGDAELWWIIADYNPQWMYFDYLPNGLVLRIPNGLPAPG